MAPFAAEIRLTVFKIQCEKEMMGAFTILKSRLTGDKNRARARHRTPLVFM